MFKYSICNETFQGWSWHSTCTQIAACGYRYVEVAPYTLANDVRCLDAGARRDLRQVAASCGLEIVGLHWLLVTPPALSITSEDQAVRRETSDYLAALAQFCADLGGKTMVLGSPSQRRLPLPGSNPDRNVRELATERLISVVRSALDTCAELDVTLCLEPLPAPEADFVLNLEEAVNIIKRVGHPNLRTMLDIKSASTEARSIPDLIRLYSSVIVHVHANDANRRGPGFGDTDYIPILRALSAANYAGPVSIEVFDYTPDPVTIAQRSLEYLRECELMSAVG